ncbi:ATP-dependent Clp protease proteolytic subunit [Streptomyces lomondensis]|uniref:ATP-dependent Clp protease proteolytic subunit n=1 Tax=Streptomyces lomondensis TaxID=68229 RepID=A0ABQ2X4Y7_9ACTN|nr:ATP-dependent Clp protease proteolytic subunit [Streptomyces lomondensis]MCF0078025.1 ATP-dependent Clp protease proteolytic subunit [Streptomyces lomondensis]GGW99837.1 putative ATP-dependent Clp protease proteolytic subunit-like protein [Streptomyces lomondensis]
MTRPSARYVLPEFTERTSSGYRTMDPYSKLLEGRIVFLGTPVDETSANDVMAQFMYLEHQAPDRDIALYINSPGGTFHAMTAIYDTMRYVTCDVETICLGQAGAAATVLLAAGTPGKRSVLPEARLVIHQPALPEPVRGQASDLAIQADELTRIRTRMEEMLARHTGRTREQVSSDIEREKILTAQEAVEYGLVDRIVPNRRATLTAPTGR